jgi:hypothetical protein
MSDLIKTNNNGIFQASQNEPRPWWILDRLKSVDKKAQERKLFVDTFIYPGIQETFYRNHWIDRGDRQGAWQIDKLRGICRLPSAVTPKNWSYRIAGYVFETYQISANLYYVGDDDVLGLMMEFNDNGDSTPSSLNHNFLAVVYTPADITPAAIGGEAVILYKFTNGVPSILYQWDTGLWGGVQKNIPYRMTVTRLSDRLIINFRGQEFYYQLDSISGLNESYRNGKCGIICNSQTAAYSDFIQESYSLTSGNYAGTIGILDALRYQYDQSFNNYWFENYCKNVLRIHEDYKYLIREGFFSLDATDQANSTCSFGTGSATNGIWYSQNFDMPENIDTIKIIPQTELFEGCSFDATEYAVAIDFVELDLPSTYTWQVISNLEEDIVVPTGSLVKFRSTIPNNINLKTFIALIGKNTMLGVF